MSDEAHRPFLIQRQTDGTFRLTVRDIRYNSQGYPLVSGPRQLRCEGRPIRHEIVTKQRAASQSIVP